MINGFPTLLTHTISIHHYDVSSSSSYPSWGGMQNSITNNIGACWTWRLYVLNKKMKGFLTSIIIFGLLAFIDLSKKILAHAGSECLGCRSQPTHICLRP